MLRKIRKYIRRFAMFHPGDRVVVGVSGGADSMALLTSLHRLREELGIELIAAHLDHGLRGPESQADGEFVAQAAARIGIPFRIRRCDIRELSVRSGRTLEEAARRARYVFFDELTRQLPAEKIALGHHFQDQAETVTLHFLRGAGGRGLRGILPVRDGIVVRPLLAVTKEEILSFLKREGIEYREDASNRSVQFTRNRIRHDLMPRLKELNPRIEARLHDLAETMRLEDEFIQGQTSDILEQWHIDLRTGECAFLLSDFSRLHEALRRRLVKTLLEERSPDKNGITQAHVKAVLRLAAEGRVGQRLVLPFGTQVQRDYDRIRIGREGETCLDRHTPERPGDIVTGSLRVAGKEAFSYSVNDMPATVLIRETGQRLRFTLVAAPALPASDTPLTAYLDYGTVEMPLEIRNMMPGDRFTPLGMKGTKKIKAFFIDRKVPRQERPQIPIVTDRNSVLWIVGLAISETARVTPLSSTCLKIEII